MEIQQQANLVPPQRLSGGGGDVVITVGSEERKPPATPFPSDRRSLSSRSLATLMLPINIFGPIASVIAVSITTHALRGCRGEGSRTIFSSAGTAARGGHQGVDGRGSGLTRPWLHIKHQPQHEETKQKSKEA